MKIGYARVSTMDQSLDAQIRALEGYGCDIIHKEKISSMRYRPKLESLICDLKNGDILVVYKLDRLGRSVSDLVKKIEIIAEKKANFVSLSDKFDTTTTQGKLILGISMVFAEFERNLISDRTKDGIAAKRKKGVVWGRPIKLTSLDAYKVVKRELIKGKKPREIYKRLGINRHLFYRLKKHIENETKKTIK
jgi:DNA invertase Pin-like site-specific DNA recombinase